MSGQSALTRNDLKEILCSTIGTNMSLKFRKAGQHCRWVGGLTAAGLIVLASGVPASADDQNISVAKEAQILWIDVENRELSADQVSGLIISKNSQQELDFKASPSGLTATLDEFPQDFILRLNAPTEVSAQVAVTAATADQTVISEQSSRVVITAIDDSMPDNDDNQPPSEDDTQDADEQKPNPDSSDSDSENSEEGGGNSTDSDADESKPDTEAKDSSVPAVTGASVLWPLTAAVVLVAAGLGTLLMRRRGAHKIG